MSDNEELSPEDVILRDRWRLASNQEILDAYDHDEPLGLEGLNRATQLALAREKAAEGEICYPLGRLYRSYGKNDIHILDIKYLQISDRRRSLVEARVAELMDSIRRVGLLHPPTARFAETAIVDGEEENNVPFLMSGRHRVEAWRRLGHSTIPCLVIKDASEIDAELIEISENLHRAELTALQRSEQVARWIELTKHKGEAVSRQPDAKPGRPEGGVRAAARELGISEASARRAVTVAALSPEAKLAAVEAGLDDNQSALMDAARQPESAQQVEVITSRSAPMMPIYSTEQLRAQRTEREAAFMAAVEKIEPLLQEIEYQGDGEDTVFAYDDLTYLQIAERYQPVMAIDLTATDSKDGRRTYRRVQSARDTLFQILLGTAQAEAT